MSDKPELVHDLPLACRSLQAMAAHLKKIQEYRQALLVRGVDYDIIPGCPKPSLLLSGAELLRQAFGLHIKMIPERCTCRELPGGHREYTVAYGAYDEQGRPYFEYERSCSTLESKYRYREKKRVCPVCHRETVIRGKEEFGGGWICFKKLGGCGTKFRIGEPRIEEQAAGQVENPDIADCYSTVQAMAAKRAFIGVVRIACGASREFTQDIEDLPEFARAKIIAAEVVNEGKNVEEIKNELDEALDRSAVFDEVTEAPAQQTTPAQQAAPAQQATPAQQAAPAGDAADAAKPKAEPPYMAKIREGLAQFAKMGWSEDRVRSAINMGPDEEWRFKHLHAMRRLWAAAKKNTGKEQPDREPEPEAWEPQIPDEEYKHL